MENEKDFQKHRSDTETLADIVWEIIHGGFGRPVSQADIREPWTSDTLADELGVESRTVNNWLGGDGISEANRNALATLAGRYRPGSARTWKARLQRAQSRLSEQRRSRKTPNGRSRGIGRPRFCAPDPDSFDLAKGRCTVTAGRFPFGTRVVVASFAMDGVRRGSRFERRWYLEGQRLMSRSDFNTQPWDGFTFIANWRGLPSGRYTLRVIADGLSREASFHIEPDPNPNALGALRQRVSGLAWRLRYGFPFRYRFPQK